MDNEPRQCFYIPTNAYVEGKGWVPSLVTDGKPGHQPMTGANGDEEPWYWGRTRDDYALAVETAQMQNERRGIDAADAAKIIAGSIAVPFQAERTGAYPLDKSTIDMDDVVFIVAQLRERADQMRTEPALLLKGDDNLRDMLRVQKICDIIESRSSFALATQSTGDGLIPCRGTKTWERHDGAVRARFEIEWRIVERVIIDLIAAGFALAINHEEEDAIEIVHDLRSMEEMFACDEDYLYARKRLGGDTIKAQDTIQNCYGWVRFVYGNEGWDVVCDYSTRLEAYMQGAQRISDEYGN